MGVYQKYAHVGVYSKKICPFGVVPMWVGVPIGGVPMWGCIQRRYAHLRCTYVGGCAHVGVY